jgi:hypothetical protein
MTDLYYLVSIGALAVTNAYVARRWQRAERGWSDARVTIKTIQRLWSNDINRLCAWRDKWRTDALHLQGRLDAQSAKRSAAAKHARAAQIAKQQALRDATTAQLAGEVRAKARKLRVAA